MQRSSLNAVLIWSLSAALAVLTAGCEEGDIAPQASEDTPIEIEGTWQNSDFGRTSSYVIDDESWSSDFGDGPTVSQIVEFSNDDRHAVLAGPDYMDPAKTVYSRNVWTAPAGDSVYFCTATFGCETPELTLTGDGDDDNGVCNPPMVDETDLEGAGCGNFSWTKLTKS
jgi:hypothetical protein